MRLGLLCAIAAAGLLSSQARAAGFSGSTVNFQYDFPSATTPYLYADNGDKVVSSGLEVNHIAFVANLDIAATNISVTFNTTTYWTNASFNGWVISDQIDNLSAITGVTINPLTDLAGFTQSNIVWDANSIAVNWQGLAFDPSTVFSLDVAFAPPVSGVPEPDTWAMMLLGFGAIGFSMRRRDANRRLQAV